MPPVFDPFREYIRKLKADNAHLPRGELLRLLEAARAEHVMWILTTAK
jgi:hypothetical protein